METILKQALVAAFDDVHERKIIRNLFDGFENLLKDHEFTQEELRQELRDITDERDFYRSQFEQITGVSIDS